MKQTPRTLFLLIALAAATLTASLGVSIASVLLPTLSHVFSAPVSSVQWVVLIYLISVTVTIVSAGRLGDLLGHRRVLIAGVALFLTASIIAAIAPTLAVLIIGRAVQGIGGAILIALSMSIARDMVTSEHLGSAMGLLGTMSAVGTALGPSLGGLLLTWSDWRMAFYVLAGCSAITLLLAMLFIDKKPERTHVSLGELDIPGASALIVALAIYALLTSGGAADIPIGPIVLVPMALAAFVLFIGIEIRTRHPLVPMRLLYQRRTGTGFVMNILVGTVMMATLVVGPFFLAYSLNLNDALIGLVMAVGPVVAALSGLPAGRLTDYFGPKRVMIFGLLHTTAGLLCLALLPRIFGVAGYIGSLAVLTPAFQLFLASNNTAVLANAPKEQRGRLSGLLGLSRNLGLMSGASAMSTLFVTVLGTGDASQASDHAVANAFSTTFIVAAGLSLIAAGLAIYSHAGQSKMLAEQEAQQ